MAGEDYGRLKLLFVDDSPHTCLILREMLRDTIWSHAAFAGDVAAALEEIGRNPPDLVFTDWQMPGGSGLDLIRAIRVQPDIPDPLLPVMVLTASGDAPHVLTARNAGALDFLVKPVTLRRIIERVNAAVTRPPAFVVSLRYVGPDKRRVARPIAVQRRAANKVPPGVTVLPPDFLLRAKVSGEPAALREAMHRRAEAIALIRDTHAGSVPQRFCPELLAG